MEKLKQFIITLIVVSIVFLCVGAGYMVRGQVYVPGSDTANHENVADYRPQYTSHDDMYLEMAPETAVQSPAYAHKYVVTSANGYIVVHYASYEGKASHLRTITNIPTCPLALEELERLQLGIHVYTEEELFRILEDYGS